jgi:transcriptional regulator with XRE-family HTH domain
MNYPRDDRKRPINLGLIRRALGLSQADLAARLQRQCTGQYIAQIESGRRTAPPALLVQLADALGVRVGVLSADHIRIDVSNPMKNVVILELPEEWIVGTI